MSLLPTEARVLDMLLNLSQIVAERHHGQKPVADAIAAAQERFGDQWALFFVTGGGDPYEKLMKWHKATLEKKPSVVTLK
jgi:nicotinic acid mononucleotide adenylyltransferase